MHVELLNCSASCAIVRSFFKAAKATFALKVGVWFRRARFFIVAPDLQAKHACLQAGIPLNALFKIPGPPLSARLEAITVNVGADVRGQRYVSGDGCTCPDRVRRALRNWFGLRS
jgi:hypothetical protein